MDLDVRAYSSTGAYIRVAASGLLGGVAGSGLFVSTTTMIERLAAIAVSDVWLLPGLVLIGILISLANEDDVARSTTALLLAGALGAALVGFAIAAPGFQIAGVRTAQIDKGIQFGLLALLLIVLFGLAGIVTAWVIGAFIRPGRL